MKSYLTTVLLAGLATAAITTVSTPCMRSIANFNKVLGSAAEELSCAAANFLGTGFAETLDVDTSRATVLNRMGAIRARCSTSATVAARYTTSVFLFSQTTGTYVAYSPTNQKNAFSKWTADDGLRNYNGQRFGADLPPTRASKDLDFPSMAWYLAATTAVDEAPTTPVQALTTHVNYFDAEDAVKQVTVSTCIGFGEENATACDGVVGVTFMLPIVGSCGGSDSFLVRNLYAEAESDAEVQPDFGYEFFQATKIEEDEELFAEIAPAMLDDSLNLASNKEIVFPYTDSRDRSREATLRLVYMGVHFRNTFHVAAVSTKAVRDD